MKSERPGCVTNPAKKNIFWYAGLWDTGTGFVDFIDFKFLYRKSVFKKK